MTSFTGIWVPLVTPFHNGEIDFPALHALARRIADAGVTGLVACATTGEAASLGDEEQLAVLDAILKAVPGCPIVMGLAGNNLAHLLERQKQIQRRPIAGLQVPPPYYIRPSQAGVAEFFRTIANAATVPVILYDIPYRTGVAIERPTFELLAQHPKIAAVKDCGGSQKSTMALIAEAELDVLAGDDQQILATLCLGGTGAISAAAHIRPDWYVRIAQLVKAGDLDQARALFYRLLPLIELLFEEPNPGPLKAALSMMGEMRNEVRTPMQPASTALMERLTPLLKQLDCV
jgi:4-hydroxy-tetrahydrodipicolinate synthase